MRITVLYFAQAREHAQRNIATFELPDGSRVRDAVAAIRSDHPELEPLWPYLAIAVDGVLAPQDGALRDGAELALLPPVSGG
jgi:MoaE-MoaD fusion protein